MTLQLNNNPIGIFDSGIGGITILKPIMKNLPNENIIYFGDIARLPYGVKSVKEIRQFSAQIVEYLLSQNVKAIVIACNTISAVAKDYIIKLAGSTPVIDVISAGVKDAISKTINNRIGVIATVATAKSNSHAKLIHKFNQSIKVLAASSTLFVPFIEAGITEHKSLELVAEECLMPLIKEDVDTLILGCTHYPLIKETISKVMGANVCLVDPAEIVSLELINQLYISNILSKQTSFGKSRFIVTKLSKEFKNHSQNFLNIQIDDLELAKINYK